MAPKCYKINQIPERNTLHRFAIAVSLLSVLPVLSLTYLDVAADLHTGFPTPEGKKLLLASIILMISSGVMLLVDHANRIGKLRQYTMDAPRTAFSPRKIKYLETASLHDLKYIEKYMEFSLKALNRQLELLEHKNRVENDLRMRLEQNQLMLRDMEGMCQHVDKPASTLKLRLSVLKRLDLPLEQKTQIEECNKEIDTILKILSQLEKAPCQSAIIAETAKSKR